ncbi:MAG: PD-(D/E)XK nuclease family protein, partial [Anaerohalosphaera sp.]|nr:PD-(D/E)XK nuclease family protein [Anaerohalosphaera sp.]
RDIDLAAVLRSPLFNFSETDLAKIRCHDKTQNTKRNLFCSITDYAETGLDNDLRSTVSKTLEQITNWRQAAHRKSLADLIWEIYRHTNYLSFVSALPNGSQRRSNLLKFHDRAIQFESFIGSSRSTSMSRFVEFIEKLLDQGQDWAPAQPENETQNAVRIMSVHRSKGLEFPIVFLADLQKRFNLSDSIGDCLFDSENALGLRIVEPNSRTKLTSIAHQVIAEKKHRTMIAEEMRILYVALTRARERLILVGSQKSDSAAKLIRSASLADAAPLPDFIINSARKHFDWILSALACGPQLCNLFDIDTPVANDDRNLYSAILSDQDELNYSIQTLQNRTEPKQTDLSSANLPAEMMHKLKESLTWKYPFAPVTDMPAKTSVSKLTHREDEYVQKNFSDAFTRTPKAIEDSEPSHRADRKLIGTATHLIIEKLDLNESISEDSIRKTANSLSEGGYIPQNLLDHIEYNKIMAFFSTDIGKLVFDPANTVEREWPFTFAHPTEVENENTIVQGIIDMLIKTPQGLIIIDFKTDNVNTKPQIDQRTQTYQDQLKHYADAASKILNTNIKAAYLHFLQPSKTIKIDI